CARVQSRDHPRPRLNRRAHLYHSALIDYSNSISCLYGAQSVRNDEHRAAGSCSSQSRLHGLFALRIECTRGLVE
ncbi:hypothetical protein PMAYCL1PPCAC_04816, partial [Pristionchus mayeri]